MQASFVDLHESWSKMLPLTYTRPIADLRVGILKIHEKWRLALGLEEVFFKTQDFLQEKFPKSSHNTLCLRSNLLPTDKLIERIHSLKENEVLTHGDLLLAGFFEPNDPFEAGSKESIDIDDVSLVDYPWDLFRLNGEEIKADYDRITANQQSKKIHDPHTIVYGDQLFIDEGVQVKAAILNTESGPIYLGKYSEVQEGAIIKGPFALGEHSVVNMGAKIKGDTTIGPHSKAGGEITNSILQGYSNKGHDGFLGNSVIGEWCNLGADTNTSNLKNNYANVKMWDFNSSSFKDTGLQFCGLIMGDHSKCGINTMFNTGTTIGVAANIFGDGFPRNFIPSFAWGGASGFSTHSTKKVFETAELVMSRRGIKLGDLDEKLLESIFQYTAQFRVWEKK